MKKAVFLFIGTMMIAGGLLVSCQKKETCKPMPRKPMGQCHPCKPVPPDHPCSPCGPCKRY